VSPADAGYFNICCVRRCRLNLILFAAVQGRLVSVKVSSMSTPSLHKPVNVLDRLKRQMGELQALRKAVAKAEQSCLMAVGRRELGAYPKLIELPASFQLGQKPTRPLSSPCPSLRRVKGVTKLRKHRWIRASRPFT
jgi:hypothetical protein